MQRLVLMADHLPFFQLLNARGRRKKMKGSRKKIQKLDAAFPFLALNPKRRRKKETTMDLFLSCLRLIQEERRKGAYGHKGRASHMN